MYNDKINKLLNIEQKILKIYNNLIQSKLNNNEKQHRKEINNLSLLLEYEEEKINDFIETENKSVVDFYINYNKFDFVPFNNEVLNKEDLYRYRLLKILVRKCDDSIINEDLSELYTKYIWNINDEKNEQNNEKITKIQYYLCYLDRTIENFYLDKFR